MLKRRTAAGAMAGVLVVLVTGCQGSSDPAAGDAALGSTPAPSSPAAASSTPPSTPATSPATSQPSGIAGLPAAAILTKTQTAAKAAASVRMKGALTDEGDRMVLDVQLTRTGGQGTMSINGAGFSVIVLGRTAYLKISEKFWRAQLPKKSEADAAIAVVGGRWIKTSLDDKDLGDLAAFASKPQFFDTLFEPSGTPRKTTPRTVGGVNAVGLTEPDGTLWVDAATALPLRLESGKDALTFSQYNKVSPPKAPPAAQVIDGKTLGM